MDVRGERECKSCGTRWSYFETGSVECPECGSVHSVGVGERAQHTDSGADLDLGEARTAASEDLRAAVPLAVEACREYCRSRGFVAGGELLDLDDTYLAAQELRHAASIVDDAMRVDDDEKRYVLALLNGADAGDRPDPDDVPESMRGARGLGYAAAVDSYRAGVRSFCEGQPPGPEHGLLEQLRDHVKRVRALDGDVDPADSERLVLAARAIANSIRGDGSAAERAREHLDQLQPTDR